MAGTTGSLGLNTHETLVPFYCVRSLCVFRQAKEILFTKRLLNGYMSEYTDQPADKIEVRVGVSSSTCGRVGVPSSRLCLSPGPPVIAVCAAASDILCTTTKSINAHVTKQTLKH